MPPQLLFDISRIDLSQVLYDQEVVRQNNPHRGDMEMLNGIVWADESQGYILGYKDVREDEFWVAGHIPGRPLFPGVLMIETAAQLASFYTKKFLGWTGFVGFGGVTDVKFRQQVLPGSRMYVLCVKNRVRHKHVTCSTQGIVNGQLVFEAAIVGVEL